MERHLPKLTKFIVFFTVGTLFFPLKPYAQELTQKHSIQLNLWAGLDAYPENYTEANENLPDNRPFSYPIHRIKDLSVFLLEGMIYGWEFDYTPSDKMRNVKEFFERKSIKSLGEDSKKIIYKKPILDEGKFSVWIEFIRSPEMISYLNYWESSKHDKAKGRGTASLEKGFAGIQEACDLALKDAVREYYRTQTKNKPKQITGKVILRGQPRISAISGKYVVDLDFFVETGRIILYKQF